MTLQVVQRRRGLQRVARRLREGTVTIGFLGGSITDPRPGYNWPEPVIGWFVNRFPGVRLSVENAAIGATGSALAVFRAQRDIIDRHCDLVFVEYAVNDQGAPAEARMRTREGLIRKLLAGTGRDVVLVHTFCQDMYDDISAGRVPASIAEFEELGQHYGVPSVWAGLHALREVMAGRMRWEEWLPDGLHPQSRGSLSYAQSVIAYLEQELSAGSDGDEIPCGDLRPQPLNVRHWESTSIVPLERVHLHGPWSLRRFPHHAWIDRILSTAAVGAGLSFRFSGRGLALAFDFGKTASEFRYRFDDSDWIGVTRERPDWCGDGGWYRLETLADDLDHREHAFNLEVVHGNRPECTGTNCHLALIGIVD